MFYALRPGFIRAQKFTRWHALNFAVQFSFDYLILQTWGQSALWYFVISSFLAGSLHPCAAHFIAEHYVFPGMKAIEPKPGKAQPDSAQETASYYGWLNALCYNVGYHQEHHDFPACVELHVKSSKHSDMQRLNLCLFFCPQSALDASSPIARSGKRRV